MIELGGGGEELVGTRVEGVFGVAGNVSALVKALEVGKGEVYRPSHHLFPERSVNIR